MDKSEDTEDLFSAAMIAKMNEQNELVLFFEMIRKKTITFVNLLVIRNLLELGYTPNDRDDYVSGEENLYFYGRPKESRDDDTPK